MESHDLSTLLGHDVVEQQVVADFENPDTRIVRITGPSGSGKTWIAQHICDQWRDGGGTCVIALGDDALEWRELFPLLSGLSTARQDWAEMAHAGSRSATQVAGVVSGTGGIGTSVFDLITASFRQKTERALIPYSETEKRVILDLRRLARRRRLLLIADNAHWWDSRSLCLLKDLTSDRLRRAIPQLEKVSILLVDTAGEQRVAAPEPFEAIASDCESATYELSHCPRSLFPEVLMMLGAPEGLSKSMIDELFTATNGHLKLVDQVAAYLSRNGSGQRKEVDSEHLSNLVDFRLGSLGSFSPDLNELLARAAVLGLSCSERDLRCLADRRRSELRELVRQAEKIGFVEKSETGITFSHDVVRTSILKRQTPSRLEELNSKLAECIRLLRPGDYEGRARSLLQAGEREDGREMVALAGVVQIRKGVPRDRVLARAAEAVPDDRQLLSYLETMADGYAAVARGSNTSVPSVIRISMPGESMVTAAERNYLASIFSLGRQSTEGALEACRLLRAWVPKLEGEDELRLRFLVLLQQAQVLAEEFDEARETETLLEQELTDRAKFDPLATDMINIQHRRAAGIMEPEFAIERIKCAVDYFRLGRGDPHTDLLELFRSLTNLVAVEVRLGQHEDARQHAAEAEGVAVELQTGHRLDVLANNLVIADHRSGAVSLDETIARQSAIVYSPEGPEDNFLERCNLVAYLFLDRRDEEARSELERLSLEVGRDAIDESYLIHYWGALEIASLVVAGDLDGAIARNVENDSFVGSLRWPSKPYIRRRQERLNSLIPTLDPDAPREELDRALVTDDVDEIGPAWDYYARLFPCCELSFWADS